MTHKHYHRACNQFSDYCPADLDSGNVFWFHVHLETGTGSLGYLSDYQEHFYKGLASKVFAVGDQLTCQRGSTTLVWDIIGFDIDTPADKQFTHSMTLQLHEVFDFVQFNAPAAMYYAEEELAAGIYHVTPKNGWSGGMGNGKTYQFTLTKAVPKGGQIVWNGAWDQDPLKYDIKTYASPTSTTVIETVKPTEGTGGTELTTLNSGQRMCYGSTTLTILIILPRTRVLIVTV